MNRISTQFTETLLSIEIFIPIVKLSEVPCETQVAVNILRVTTFLWNPHKMNPNPSIKSSLLEWHANKLHSNRNRIYIIPYNKPKLEPTMTHANHMERGRGCYHMN